MATDAKSCIHASVAPIFSGQKALRIVSDQRHAGVSKKKQHLRSSEESRLESRQFVGNVVWQIVFLGRPVVARETADDKGGENAFRKSERYGAYGDFSRIRAVVYAIMSVGGIIHIGFCVKAGERFIIGVSSVFSLFHAMKVVNKTEASNNSFPRLGAYGEFYG